MWANITHFSMKRKHSIVSTLFVLASSFPAFSQVTKGRIVDKRSGEPVAFAHITCSHKTNGAISDIDGNFLLILPESDTCKIVITHISYQSRTIPINHSHEEPITIQLEPSQTLLSGIVVRSGDDPAVHLIRKVIENKHFHDPKKYKSYQYESYTKLIMRKQYDSLDKGLKEKRFLFMAESLSETFHKNPGKHHESLRAFNISGFTSPIFAANPTDYQPLGFYDDYINILGENYVSPISLRGMKLYQFELVDSLILPSNDTLLSVIFKPQATKNHLLLEGKITIVTDRYALKNVYAKSTDPFAKISFQIQQNYLKIDSLWFPTQLNTDLYFNDLSINGVNPMFEARAYLSQIQINKEIKDTIFSPNTINLQQKNDAKRLLEMRPVPLTKKETNTFTWYDSLPRARKFITTLQSLTEIALWNGIPMGPVDVNLSQVLLINKYEKIRLGLGLSSNELLSRFISFNAFAGYGFNDQKWKYGGGIQLNLLRSNELFLKIDASNNLKEIGSSDLLRQYKINPSQVFRDWAGEKFDGYKQVSGAIGFRPAPSLRVLSTLTYESIAPQYEYSMTFGNEQLNTFKNVYSSLELRLVLDERRMHVDGRTSLLKYNYPIVSVRYAKSFKTWEGMFNYTQLDFRIKHQWPNRKLGNGTMFLNIGLIDGVVPLGKFYFAPGAMTTGYLVENHFQTIENYEYVASQFVSFFITQPVYRIFTSKYTAPEVIIRQGIGMGKLKHTEVHNEVALTSFEKGLLETGIMVNNLVRMNYLNVAYVNMGLGAFFRFDDYGDGKNRYPILKFNASISF